MKQIFVINNCHTLNDIAYCSKRIKEHLDANNGWDKKTAVMASHSDAYRDAHQTLVKMLGRSQTLFYGEHQSFYVYHDIHHIENTVIILLLDEHSTASVVRALMHNPAFEVQAKGIQLFAQREPCLCEYLGEL